MTRPKIDVIVNNNDGRRNGSFIIDGVKSSFPTQAITSTNLNHAKFIKESDFDFKTNVVEIVEFKLKKLLTDSDYRGSEILRISKILEKYPQRNMFFVPHGIKSMKPQLFTREFNRTLIDFQISCGFKLIKVFFRSELNANDSSYYRDLIPDDKIFVPVLDESLSHDDFKELYLEFCDTRKDKIIAFFGRKPVSSNPEIKPNFLFMSKRRNDKVIRLISSISKSAINNVVNSLLYYYFGFDVYSFITITGNPNISNYKLKALDKFKYKYLTKNSNLICEILGINLFDSCIKFGNFGKLSSIPASIHAIVQLNKSFKTIHMDYTLKKIKEILDSKKV